MISIRKGKEESGSGLDETEKRNGCKRGGRGDDAVLTPHVAQCLGMAFARFAAEKLNKPVTQITIAIGRDSRLSGPTL